MKRTCALVFVVCVFCAASVVMADGEARVVVVDPLTDIRSAADVESDGEVLRLVAPRNGYCSGKVVAFESLTVNPPVLRGPGGEIPAEGVRIRYSVKDSPYQPEPIHDRPWLPKQSRLEPRYDVLMPSPPEDPEVLPIWLTVHIPADQAPGLYTGTIEAGDASVPVEVRVCDWACPDPSDWVTYTGLVHSPETGARHYGVELWSDEHWSLIEQTLEFAAALGNEMVSIPVLYRNELCGYPWVTFRKAEDGYEPDFSIVERYLEVYDREVGEPQTVVVMAWDVRCGTARHGRNRGRPATDIPIVVEQNGELTPVEVPVPGGPSSEKVFAPLMEGIRELVSAQGWAEEAMLVGWATDQRPSRKQVEFFRRIAPWARWAIFTHGRGDAGPDRKTGLAKKTDGVRIVEGMEIGHYVHPFSGLRAFPVPHKAANEPHTDGIVGGWNLEYPEYTNYRVYMFHTAPLAQYRSFPGGSMVRGSTVYKGRQLPSGAGMSNIPLDFWEDEGGNSQLGRGCYWKTWVAAFHRWNSYWLIAPGPDGPVGTERFEMLREGMQETEARIVIEKALEAGNLPAELAEECRTHLLERAKIKWKEGEFARSNAQWQKGGWHDYGIPENWRESSARLFDLAGKVAALQGQGSRG